LTSADSQRRRRGVATRCNLFVLLPDEFMSLCDEQPADSAGEKSRIKRKESGQFHRRLLMARRA
jgi:hypothetical protein